MKSELLVYTKPKPRVQFPILLQDPEDGMVLLATEFTESGYNGIIVYSTRPVHDRLAMGRIVKGVSELSFSQVFKGAVAISN